MTAPHKPMAPVGALEAPQVTMIQNRPHPSADGLVDRAHRHSTDRGMFIIGTRIQVVDVPRAENQMTCIVVATIVLSDGQNTFEFQGLGDANPTNCTSANTAAAFPRMAETRALSRALSVALNVPEAVAEELATGGNFPQAPQGGYQAPQGAPQGGYSAPGGAWNGVIPFGRNKDKHITDQSVDLKDLEWLSQNLKLRDKVTPDHDKIAMVVAEIQRRQGMQPGVPPQGYQQPMQQYQQPMAQPGMPQPGYAPQGYQQPMAQPGMPPQGYPQPGMPPAGPVDNGWRPSPQDIQEVVMLGAQRSMNYQHIKDMCQQMFSNNDPGKLTQDQFNMLRVNLGGQPR